MTSLRTSRASRRAFCAEWAEIVTKHPLGFKIIPAAGAMSELASRDRMLKSAAKRPIQAVILEAAQEVPIAVNLGSVMPSAYEKLGIRFQYPDNWTLDEKDALQGDNSVTVYSPGGAFWSVTIHPSAVRPQEMCDAALKAMRETYEELDAEKIEESVAGRNLSGYDLNFYCLDLTNTALIRAASTRRCNLLILCQADDREFAEVEPVFRAMTHSLLSDRDR